MRSTAEIQRVLSLVRDGWTDRAISRATGIPRATVRWWRLGNRSSISPASVDVCGICTGRPYPNVPSRRYAYLLGQYLGDGAIARMPNGVFVLRIYSDLRYPGIIAECAEAIRAVMPLSKVCVRQRAGERMVIISCYSKHWPCLLPQHGRGRKHLRPIVLTVWQEELVQSHPEAFLRGLIHSDGCRVINHVRQRRYAYPRYQFSNESEDIKALFANACNQLGIAWRKMNRKNLSIARREAVALMDTFVGPKA